MARVRRGEGVSPEQAYQALLLMAQNSAGTSSSGQGGAGGASGTAIGLHDAQPQLTQAMVNELGLCSMDGGLLRLVRDLYYSGVDPSMLPTEATVCRIRVQQWGYDTRVLPQPLMCQRAADSDWPPGIYVSPLVHAFSGSAWPTNIAAYVRRSDRMPMMPEDCTRCTAVATMVIVNPDRNKLGTALPNELDTVLALHAGFFTAPGEGITAVVLQPTTEQQQQHHTVAISNIMKCVYGVQAPQAESVAQVLVLSVHGHCADEAMQTQTQLHAMQLDVTTAMSYSDMMQAAAPIGRLRLVTEARITQVLSALAAVFGYGPADTVSSSAATCSNVLVLPACVRAHATNGSGYRALYPNLCEQYDTRMATARQRQAYPPVACIDYTDTLLAVDDSDRAVLLHGLCTVSLLSMRMTGPTHALLQIASTLRAGNTREQCLSTTEKEHISDLASYVFDSVQAPSCFIPTTGRRHAHVHLMLHKQPARMANQADIVRAQYMPDETCAALAHWLDDVCTSTTTTAIPKVPVLMSRMCDTAVATVGIARVHPDALQLMRNVSTEAHAVLCGVMQSAAQRPVSY